MHPLAPSTLEQTGLNADLVQQLVMKTLYFGGELAGTELAKRLGLSFSVFEPSLEFLKNQRWCEISGGSIFGGASYRYRITDAGRSRAALSLEQNQYVGIAPVPLGQYRTWVEKQSIRNVHVTKQVIRDGFQRMVLSDAIHDVLGPAINSAQSIDARGVGLVFILRRQTPILRV